MIRRLATASTALAMLSGCAFALEGPPGDDLPTNYDWSKVQLNIAPWPVVAEKCDAWGLPSPFYAGCACVLDKGETHDNQGGQCHVPEPYTCVVWSTGSLRTLGHELWHCPEPRWH